VLLVQKTTTAVEPSSSEPGGASVAPWRPVVGTTAACLVTFAALGALFLSPYPLNGFSLPVGWDAPFYVWRAKVTAFAGLDPIGTIRSGTPLLLAVLTGASGQNAFTMVALAPALLAGVGGLGSAAMARSALGVGALWVPVVAVFTWVGFGRVGMIGGHLDNVLNAALVLSAFGAACAAIAGGKGAVAVAVLLSAAGLAHWAFHAYAVAVLLAAWFLFVLTKRSRGDRGAWRSAAPLVVATGASVIFTALTFLAPPPQGGAIRIFRPAIRRLLMARLAARLSDGLRYLVLPFSAMGAVAMVRSPVPAERSDARTFLVSLMAAWLASVVAAILVQLVGIPVAASRLLHFLFALPFLGAVALWWGGRGLSARSRWFGVVALLTVSLVVGGFTALAWTTERTRRPWFEAAAVRQVGAAATYVARNAPDRDVVYTLESKVERSSSAGRWWHVVRAVLPPDQIVQANRYYGSIQELAAEPVTPGREAPLAIVVQRYNLTGFERAVESGADVVAPGVVVVGGTAPGEAFPLPEDPRAATSVAGLLGAGGLVVAIWFLAGGGWAIVFLPPDPAVRVMLAPGLGVGLLTLVALAWERLGLSLSGAAAFGPVALVVVVGWGAAALSFRPGGTASQGEARA
jgi:hypothetical protein